MKLVGTQSNEERPFDSNSPRSSGGSSNDSPSFAKMKLVIKNTFIGGYDAEEDPPRTLARSASDSKIDCQSSTSSVVFWYPQRGGSASQSNSSVASRSESGQDETEHDLYHYLVSRQQESSHPPAMPYQEHHLLDRERTSDLPSQVPMAMQMPQYGAMPRGAPAEKPSSSAVFEQPVRPPGDFTLLTGNVLEQGGITSLQPPFNSSLPQLSPPPSSSMLAPDLELTQADGLPLQLQLQNEFLRGARLKAPMGMMLPGNDLSGQVAERSMPFPANGAEQLRQQLIESQMQQAQLQQQMQQLQLRQQQLQQQLSVQPDDEQAVLAQIPFNDEGERASIGSRLHPDSCNPCIFWFKDQGLCNKGVMCDFCHFRHPGQKNKRIRPSKNTRLQMRAAQAARGS